MNPNINVNMRKHWHPNPNDARSCDVDCAPVLIPCPIPRSVTFQVRLGECFCTTGDLRYMPQDSGGDLHICPARPIRFTCSIGGETWEASEVMDVDNPNDDQGRWGAGTGDAWRSTVTACNKSWALVKALLAVGSWAGAVHPHSASVRIGELRDQRDAVFAALADMARAEQATWTAAESLAAALPKVYISPEMQVRDLEDRASSRWLSSYVEHLIEQVGVPQPTWVGWEALGEHRRSPKGSAGVAAMAIFRLSSIDLHEEPYCYVDPATLEIVP